MYYFCPHIYVYHLHYSHLKIHDKLLSSPENISHEFLSINLLIILFTAYLSRYVMNLYALGRSLKILFVH